ncbi:restriction endonuclease subunit S [Haloarcula onubensis]|uniref:Restriction endonuclease subunit S n=1 Tax=Haloarcula onubensis TaxID=2950539 RepID=A0ABU2FII1_9EURY|nr:restriction endonuclease subunit S [Halomicroarcula sp. S3CR25-11]MDS0280553.1 restriction endonuclease subunit S [Halomicroarcula sp. S3CR25-11]
MSEEVTLDDYADSASEEDSEQPESRFWGTIPDGWELVDGTDVYDVNPNPKPDEEPNTYIEMDALDTELPWPRYFGERNASEYSGKTFTAGDTLFARITPCTENGKAALVPEMDTKVGIGSTEYAVLSPKTERINPWYLYYVGKSHSIHDYAVSRMRGSTGRQRVPFSVFRRELDVSLPPLEEQRRIATILQNADRAVRKTREIIEQTKRVKRGVAQNLFHYGIDREDTKQTWPGEIPESWDVVQFSEIVGSNRNGLYKSGDAYGEGYPIAKMGNALENRVLDMSSADRLELTEEEKEKYGLREEDLIFARRAQEVSAAGDCCYVPELDELTVFESSLIRVRLTEDVNPRFYVQYFEGPVGSRSIERIVTETSISGIATSDLLDLKVALPSLEEQNEIASILWGFDEYVTALQNEADQFIRFKKALLQDLLSGTVRTTNTNIEVPEEIEQHG